MNLVRPPDFETLDSAWRWSVSAWNCLGLPLLLVVYLILAIRRPESASWADRRRSVRIIGLIHYGLALWLITAVGSALWAARAMEAVAAQVVLSEVAPALPIAFDLPLGFGLRRLNRWARWAALPVWLLRTAFAAWLVWLAWRYGAAFDRTEWPSAFAGRIMPLIVLIVLLLPGTARALRKNGEEKATPGKVDVVVALAVRGMLIVLGSVVLTDAIDCLVRAVALDVS